MYIRAKFVRFAIALLAAPLLLWLVRGTALAAPPPNDTFSNATVVTLGFSEALDTTEATTDADDAQLNASCGFGWTDASVWYAFTGTGTTVRVDTLGAFYSTGMIVGTVTPQGTLQAYACGADIMDFFAAADTTYYVTIFDPQLDGVGNGGGLNVSFYEAPPPPPFPTVDITLDSIGQINAKKGTAIISGTYSCTEAIWVAIFGNASQKVGRFLISGFSNFFEEGGCDGNPHTWSAEVMPTNGTFAGGKLQVSLNSNACRDFIDCAHDEVLPQTVSLRGGGKKASTSAVPSSQLFLPSITTNE